MACDGEALYVSDYEKGRVQKLRLSDGALVASGAPGRVRLQSVRASLTTRGGVCAWRTVGNYGQGKRGDERLNCPHGMAFVEGKLYVADCFNHRVVVYDEALRFQFAFAREGKAPGELRYPRGVAYLGAGELVVASQGNHRLDVFGLEGAFIRSIGGVKGDEPGQFKGPTEVALAHGRLYVCEKEGKRVQSLTPDGAALEVLPSPSDADLFGLCADAHRVYAADSQHHKLHVLAVRG